MQQLYTNISALVVGDAAGTVLRGVDILVDGGIIKTIDTNIVSNAKLVDCQGLTVYPGLINTHHHFFQAFVRNIAPLDWTQLDVLQWLRLIYPIFAQINEDCIYHASIVSMADLIKHGCTTAFDHQYNYSRHAGKYLVDRQFEAAALLGMRFVAGRGCNTLPLSEGSTIPDAMLETTDEFLSDCERLIDCYHDTSTGAMRQVVVAPCQPVNAYAETFIESARLARAKGVSLHTHLGEGENAAMLARYGKRSLDWCESVGFVGPDVWLAHGWEFSEAEIQQLAQSQTGLSHCPAPVYLVGAEITNIPALAAHKVRLGLGVDGQASNDNSNLADCIRSAYMLQCLVASRRQHAVPAPYEFLRMAAQGGADCLNRADLGVLQAGKAADFFAVNLNKLEYVGANHDVLSLPAKVGFSGCVDMTVINGKIVWQGGELTGLDEAKLQAQADTVYRRSIGNSAAVHALYH